jgi:phage-related protein
VADVKEILLRITGSSQDAERKLAQTARKIADVGRLKATPTVDLKGVAAAQSELTAMEAELVALGQQKVTPEVQVKIDQGLARIALLRNKLLEVHQAVVRSKGKGGPALEALIGSPQEVAQLFSQIGREAGNVGSVIQQAVAPTNGLNSSFGGLLGVVKQINPVVQGMALVIGVALVPAILALGAALASAAVGAGALAVGGLVALGPVVAGLVAVFGRFSAIMDVLNRKQQARDAQTRQDAQQSEQARQAAESRRNSENALRDAQESRTTAVRNLAAAEAAAAQAISDAQQRVRDTARDVQTATVAAYREMRDAADEAKQSVLGVLDAELSLDEAKLGVKRAKAELADLARKAGLAGTSFANLFQKLGPGQTIDMGAMRAAIKGARDQGKLTADEALNAEEAALRVNRAVLTQKQAVLDVKDAEDGRADAQQKANGFARDGIKAYEPLRTAQKNYADAVKDANKLLRDGVSGAPSVIAANDSLRDSVQRVKEAEHDLRTTVREANADMKDPTGPQALYDAARARLSDTEQRFADFIYNFKQQWKGLGKDAVQPVFDAITTNLEKTPGLMNAVFGVVKQQGHAIADAINGAFSTIKADPALGDSFKVIADGAANLVRIVGGPILGNFFTLLAHIGAAVMPLLVDAFKSLADWLGRASKGTENFRGLRKTLTPMVAMAGKFAKLIGAVVDAFVAVGEVGGGDVFGGFVDGITGAVKAFSDWVRSAQGSNVIKGFFKDTLPMVKSVVGFIARLVILGLQIIQFLAPAIKSIADMFNLVGDVLIFIFGWLNKIPAPIRSLLALFLPLGGILRLVFGPIVKLFPIIGKGIETLFTVFRRFMPEIRGALGGAGKFISGIFRPVIAVLRGIFGAYVSVVKFYFGLVWKAVRGAWDVGKGVVDKVLGLFRSIRSAIVRAFKGIEKPVSEGIGLALKVLATAMNAAIDIINGIIKAINKVTPGKVKVAGHTVFPGIPDIPTINHRQFAGLQDGGIVTSRVFRQLGEAGKEAVIPLRRSVLATIGQSILKALPLTTPRTAIAAGVGGDAGGNTYHVTLPPAPAAAIPDARYQAVQFMREIHRRGGGTT